MVKTKLELAATAAWKTWGHNYAQYCRCDGCGEIKHCRAKRRSTFLCLECFDLKGGS
jgi:hypothetical protein